MLKECQDIVACNDASRDEIVERSHGDGDDDDGRVYDVVEKVAVVKIRRGSDTVEKRAFRF